MSTPSFTICREGGHAGRALGCMASLRRANTLCDVTIQAEGQQFEAHRVVLAASSAYFRAMFGGKLEESRQKVVTIHNIPPAILGQLIDYCYTSAIEVTEDNVQVLLAAAGVLQFGWVQEVACEFLKHRLDATNCLGIAALADTHSCSELQLAAESVALQNFLEVVEGTEFHQLPAEELGKLISSDELNVQREEQVYEAVMKWIHHDVNNRKRYCGELLRNVRLPLLERSYLVTTVGTEPLIRSSEQCRDLLDEAKDFLLLPEKRSALEGPRTRPRHQMHCNEVLYAVGGWCNGDAISTVERYSSQNNGWKVMATMTKRRCGVGVASLNNLLYAVCGHDGNSYLNSVECYEPKTNQWSTRVAPTGYCRTSVGVAVLDGHIYAVGGQDGLSCLSIVERYDPKSNKWQQVSSMAYRRLGAGVAALNGCLYAVGGSDGNVPLASVERYEPGSEQWTAVASMAVHRKHLGVGVLDGILYAVGGRNEATELSSVERYDPVLDQWSGVVAMTCSRSGVGLAVVNNRLFAVGGFDGSSYLKSVEWLDQSANQWRLAGNMSYRRLGCGVGVLRLAGST